MATADRDNLMTGFSKLTLRERYKRLQQLGVLSGDDVQFLKSGGLKDIALAEKFIENVIGYFQLPLGVVTNLRLDGKDVIVPMAVEETSIIAAASKTAKWIRNKGRISTRMIGAEIIGQIQIAKVRDFARLEKVIVENRQSFVDLSNQEVTAGLVKRGGGVKDMVLRRVPRGDGSDMAVIHVTADPCDAMGANAINQVCEFLKPKIEDLSGETVTMCILSNLVDTKITEAVVEIGSVDPELGEKIVEASLFAKMDPYRAATNNKGVLNGIDPVLIATGNDWRAVESGVHAYAARDGQYRSITDWSYDEESRCLKGVLRAPLIVGTVGGVTNLHPTAKLGMNILGVEKASELSRVCAAMGLVQNLGALKALTGVGIIEGHMKLHIKNLTLGAGAEEQEIPLVARKLEEILTLTKRISLANAVEVLRELRATDRRVEL